MQTAFGGFGAAARNGAGSPRSPRNRSPRHSSNLGPAEGNFVDHWSKGTRDDAGGSDLDSVGSRWSAAGVRDSDSPMHIDRGRETPGGGEGSPEGASPWGRRGGHAAELRRARRHAKFHTVVSFLKSIDLQGYSSALYAVPGRPYDSIEVLAPATCHPLAAPRVTATLLSQCYRTHAQLLPSPSHHSAA